MIYNGYQSDNRKFCLYITIKCKGKKTFRVCAADYGKKNSLYADRQVIVDGQRTIYFSFGVSPKALNIMVVDVQNPRGADFEVTLEEGALKTYNVWLDAETREFVDLLFPFCQVAGFRQGTPQGVPYDLGQFQIRYYDVIRNPVTRTPMTTPARIGHKTGRIDFSKMRFDHFTIPMRIMIGLHEFSHKYKNPKIGLEIENEVGADINALYIYLGLGFSKVDAICVFAYVFLKAQTPQNIERMRKINEYIQKFENQEFAKLN
jgi:hypothetical protein